MEWRDAELLLPPEVGSFPLTAHHKVFYTTLTPQQFAIITIFI